MRGTPRGGVKQFQFNDDYEEIRMVTLDQDDLAEALSEDENSANDLAN